MGGNMHLLIMGCSQTKARKAGLMPAIERYQGPTWNTLRANMRGLPLEVIALSAEHGFIPAGAMIANYDRRLDRKRAGDILLHLSTPWVRDRVTRCPGRVFLMGGALYRETMIAAIGPALVARRQARGAIGWPVALNRQPGIGEQMAALNRWLRDLRERQPLSIDREQAA